MTSTMTTTVGASDHDGAAPRRPRMSYRQAARLMINKHGRNARAWALKRAAELRAEDKLEAAELWVKVGEEVAVQQAEALVGG